MGALNQLKKENPDAFKGKEIKGNSGNRKVSCNLPIKVTGFELGGTLDTNFVLGTSLVTKEAVKVRLAASDQDPKNKYKRIEVADFANPSHKRYVKKDCMMVFEGAEKGIDGNYFSRWGVVLDRDPKGTSVNVMNASYVHGVKDTNGLKSEWFRITAIPPIQPSVVSNKEEFDNELMKVLKPKFNGSNPLAYVRLTDNTGDIHVVNIEPLKADVVDGDKKYKRVVQDSKESLDFFVKNNEETYTLIVNSCVSEEIVVEVIAAATLFPGSATKEKMESQHENSKLIIARTFHVDNTEKEVDGGEPSANKYPEIGYVKCVLATRIYADGTPYLTYIKPVEQFDKAVSIRDLKDFTNKKIV